MVGGITGPGLEEYGDGVPEPSVISEAPEIQKLDPGILKLLGDVEPEVQETGVDIHPDIALRWEKVLRCGLEPDIRSTLNTKYPPANNCLFMGAPKLNPELIAAVPPGASQRDNRLGAIQGEVGSGLAALGRALTILLQGKEEGEENRTLEIIELLGDAGRLFSDVHNVQTKSRRALIISNMQKGPKDILETLPLSKGWLFGENLAGKVKAVKEVEKSGLELKAKRTHEVVVASSKKNLNFKGPARQFNSQRQAGQKYRHSVTNSKRTPQQRGGQSRPRYPQQYPNRNEIRRKY